MAENEIEAGLRPMTGAVGVTVVVVGANTWVNPGMAVDNFCTPRPLLEDAPVEEEDELAAARPEMLDEVDEVGLDSVPTNDRDVVGTVAVVMEVFAGVMVLDVVEFWDVESLLPGCVVVFSTGAIGALSVVEAVEDVVAPSTWAEPSGDDFLMSLCGLRIEDDSLVVESVLAVLLSDSWAFS